jgi:hypothetical protein
VFPEQMAVHNLKAVGVCSFLPCLELSVDNFASMINTRLDADVFIDLTGFCFDTLTNKILGL